MFVRTTGGPFYNMEAKMGIPRKGIVLCTFLCIIGRGCICESYDKDNDGVPDLFDKCDNRGQVVTLNKRTLPQGFEHLEGFTTGPAIDPRDGCPKVTAPFACQNDSRPPLILLGQKGPDALFMAGVRLSKVMVDGKPYLRVETPSYFDADVYELCPLLEGLLAIYAKVGESAMLGICKMYERSKPVSIGDLDPKEVHEVVIPEETMCLLSPESFGISKEAFEEAWVSGNVSVVAQLFAEDGAGNQTRLVLGEATFPPGSCGMDLLRKPEKIVTSYDCISSCIEAPEIEIEEVDWKTYGSKDSLLLFADVGFRGTLTLKGIEAGCSYEVGGLISVLFIDGKPVIEPDRPVWCKISREPKGAQAFHFSCTTIVDSLYIASQSKFTGKAYFWVANSPNGITTQAMKMTEMKIDRIVE